MKLICLATLICTGCSHNTGTVDCITGLDLSVRTVEQRLVSVFAALRAGVKSKYSGPGGGLLSVSLNAPQIGPIAHDAGLGWLQASRVRLRIWPETVALNAASGLTSTCGTSVLQASPNCEIVVKRKSLHNRPLYVD